LPTPLTPPGFWGYDEPGNPMDRPARVYLGVHLPAQLGTGAGAFRRERARITGARGAGVREPKAREPADKAVALV